MDLMKTAEAMWALFRPKEKKKWRQFATYVQPFMRHSALAMELLQRANDLGLEGKKISVITRLNNVDDDQDEIWFEGEMK